MRISPRLNRRLPRLRAEWAECINPSLLNIQNSKSLCPVKRHGRRLFILLSDLDFPALLSILINAPCFFSMSVAVQGITRLIREDWPVARVILSGLVLPPFSSALKAGQFSLIRPKRQKCNELRPQKAGNGMRRVYIERTQPPQG